MARQLLFIHGGGGGAFEADARLVESLRRQLGRAYDIRYPRLPEDNDGLYAIWKSIILDQLKHMGEGAILVGHSIGASVLIKMATEDDAIANVAGLFLIATPFWHDDKVWHWPEARLPTDAARRLPPRLPLFFYQGEADEVVPPEHLDMYARVFPGALVKKVPGGDHQLHEDLSVVAGDIERLSAA